MGKMPMPRCRQRREHGDFARMAGVVAKRPWRGAKTSADRLGETAYYSWRIGAGQPR